ncbi:unnamed protein product [Caenorhabditis brenneri]
MTIAFRKFPFLVQIEVIKFLDYPEFFNLSFCSRSILRTMATVKLTKISLLAFYFEDNGITVSMSEKDGTVRVLLKLTFITRFVANHNFQTMCMKNFRADSKVRRRNDDGQLYFSFILTKSLEEDAKKSFVQHVLDFISNPNDVLVQLHVRFSGELEFMPPIENLHKIVFYGEEMETAPIEQVLSTQPPTKSILVEPQITGQLQQDSRLFGTSSLLLQKTGALAQFTLENFTGSRLIMTEAEIGSATLNDFLKKWIANDGFQNLRSLVITPQEGRSILFPTTILRGITTHPWNPETRPQNYIVPAEGATIPAVTIDAQLFRDIRQDGNGKLASVDVHLTILKFLVW